MQKANENDARNLNNLSDEELVLAFHEGNAEAQVVLMQRYKNFVRSRARTYFLVGGDYEDIVQEGMIGLYKAIRDYDTVKESSFMTFADVCVKRQIISAIKSATRHKHAPLNYYVSLSKSLSDDDRRTVFEILDSELLRDPEEIILSNEKTDEMKKHINNKLSEFEKTVLYYYLDGLSYLEIASEMDKEPKSIDNALQRIKKKLNGFKFIY